MVLKFFSYWGFWEYIVVIIEKIINGFSLYFTSVKCLKLAHGEILIMQRTSSRNYNGAWYKIHFKRFQLVILIFVIVDHSVYRKQIILIIKITVKMDYLYQTNGFIKIWRTLFLDIKKKVLKFEKFCWKSLLMESIRLSLFIQNETSSFTKSPRGKPNSFLNPFSRKHKNRRRRFWKAYF